MLTSLAELTINLAALAHNYRALRARCDLGVRFMAVVKADAYGHGLIPAARTLARAGADYLGVASLEEGVALREAGLTLPIALLLGIMPEQAQAAVAAGLEVILYRADVAQALDNAARAQDKRVRVHLKADTGMGRLGLTYEEVLPFLEMLAGLPGLEVVGLVSHLATADLEDPAYTRRQVAEFQALLATARARGFPVPLSHLANSAALTSLPEAHFAMVRPGIMLYGSAGAPWLGAPQLFPVMTLRTRILQVKRLPPGSAISYGGTYVTPDWCDLAVLPVGYANGLSRRLSNRGQVLVHGQRVPIRGRVCMNLIMVEVTGVPGVSAGDPVTLLGADGGGLISGDDVAAWAETISYEVFCHLGAANPRRYLPD
jgi:alanine racemase